MERARGCGLSSILSESDDPRREVAEFAVLDAEGVYANQGRSISGLLIYTQTLEKQGDREKGVATARRVLAAARALGNDETARLAQGLIDRLSP